MLNLPNKLKSGDRVAIVSLSRGVLGEDNTSHQRELGVKRLKQFGLDPIFMPNALKGLDYLDRHPEARAFDLKTAFLDPTIKGIFCAIGGIDTYRLLPTLLEDLEFVETVKSHPKLFSGFSDTTTNHLMFFHLGMRSFYGPNFLNDFAELDNDLLPYTKKTIELYFNNQSQTEIISSPVWYEERMDFSAYEIGKPRISHPETHGYEVLRGQGLVIGELLGGCLESLASITNFDESAVMDKYQIFPSRKQWEEKILFIETSEDCINPNVYRQMLGKLAARGVFQEINGIIVGKPQNEKYYFEYQKELIAATEEWELPIIYNVNFGHAYPRTVLPYGAKVILDLDQARITIDEPFFAK